MGSPFSILRKVARLMDARSARIATGMRRRRRASRISCPSFLRARVTGTEIRDVDRDLAPGFGFPVFPYLVAAALGRGIDARQAARVEHDRGMRGFGTGGAGGERERGGRGEELHGMWHGDAEV